MRGFAQLSLAALASSVCAVSVSLNKRETPLSVVLSSAGNSEVNVAITNNGDETLNLLSKGTFLDEENPVEKVSLYSIGGSNKVPFEGIRLSIKTSGLSANDDFITLGAGQTKEITVETASLHTLTDGGDFDVYASGQLPYAKANSTELCGSLYYESNKLEMSIDGAIAATVAKLFSFPNKRSTVGSSCTDTKLSAVQTALSNCANLAGAASSAATTGTKLDTYFKSTDDSTKSTVSARLGAVASDCGGGTATTTNCDDQYSGCSANVLAYTVPSTGYINYCDIFFSDLPALATTCHGQDQATTILHEETHAENVYSPGTDDLGYGFSAASGLSTSQAIINADSYALYANAINLNC